VIYQEGSRRPKEKNKLTVIYYILYLSNIRKLSVDMEILTLFRCTSGCTWLLQGVKISISTDRNVNNLEYDNFNT
jgi:hypothetical protein